MLALLVLGLSVVALPAMVGDDQPDAPSDGMETTTAPTTATAMVAESTDRADEFLVVARVSSEGAVLEGLVTTEGQRDALVDAARRRLGPEMVVDQIEVHSGLISSTGHDNGVVALQTLLAAMPAGVTVAATTSADRLAVAGEAVDETARRELERALGTAAAASPGMGTAIEVKVPPPPPPTPEELVATAQMELDDLNVTLAGRVLFATGSNEPTDEFLAVLDQLPDLLVRHPSITLEVVGHTDDRGSAEGNLKLSEERAGAAVAYLVDAGVEPAQLSSRGAGESEPIDTNTTRDGRARNRRVELVARR